MNKYLFTGAFLSGAMAIVWVGVGFVLAHPLALTVTALIAVVYGFGALELRQFRQATTRLSEALAAIPESLPNLGDWLKHLHPSLQNPVRLRVEGERIGLPGPALTPYLVGLLVMLGMLGTFLGMVVTLNGAAFSLQGTTDLQAIRSALAAPIQGLGLAFGTSVAGVAASAMLGLMSALSRRERMLTSQLLDGKIATVLRGFSLTHQRQEAYQALQYQAHALPAVVDQLQLMMAQMDQLSQQLNQRLLSNQEGFHGEVKAMYRELAASVDQSLKDSLMQSAHVAGERIQPVVEAALSGMAREARALHERVITTAQMQLDGLSERFGAQALAQQQAICTVLAQTAQQVTANAQASAGSTLSDLQRLTNSAEALARSRIDAEAQWLAQHGARMDQLASLLQTELGALRIEEAQRGDAAVARLGDLQTALTSHLSTLGTALEDPIKHLIETASEAPRAAAAVIGQLRQEISNSVARDNELLEERSRIMATLNALLEGINHASLEQRAVIDSLVASSAGALQQTGDQFAAQVGQQTAKLSNVAAQVGSSAVDVASLSDALGFAVSAFSEANAKLVGQLQRIEAALDKSMARSDDQLAYYVAQAREIIDLSLMSQKEIFDELRQFPARQALAAEAVS
ncbi:hypothetical protein [Rhodoferax sp.]|uniref:hypothetical protein n=1 Tax=Rhodoferax sp. TaxID=50421 RepID=UPI0027235260|nr:hypothetical protein [Rhodoferax sp.]MDO9144659.1 hypothetical protein [Rhodoferax sp.]